MRSCDEILELLSAALDGELTDDEQQALDEHLDACPMCRALFVELAGLQDAAGEPEQAPAGFAQQVMEQIAAHPEQEQPDGVVPFPSKKRGLWRRWAACAAAVAVVVLAAVTLPGQLRVGPGKSSGDASPESAGIDAQNSTEGYTIDPEAEGAEEDVSFGNMDQEQQESAINAQTDAGPVSRAATAYCGVLVLTSGPLPEGLEEYPAMGDEGGQLFYEVPAEYYFSCAAGLVEQSDIINFSCDGEVWIVDPDAEYGLIVVALEP